ncbi:MAG: hypothetical protein AABZ39_20105 [Spirochaetota bacterium]
MPAKEQWKIESSDFAKEASPLIARIRELPEYDELEVAYDMPASDLILAMAEDLREGAKLALEPMIEMVAIGWNASIVPSAKASAYVDMRLSGKSAKEREAIKKLLSVIMSIKTRKLPKDNEFIIDWHIADRGLQGKRLYLAFTYLKVK